MSQIKSNPKAAAAATTGRQPTAPRKTKKNEVKKKYKHKVKDKTKMKKVAKKQPGEVSTIQWAPPKDAQQFSANWKALLQIIKTNPPEEKTPAKQNPPEEKTPAKQNPPEEKTPAKQNLKNGMKQKSTEVIHKNSVSPRQVHDGKSGKLQEIFPAASVKRPAVPQPAEGKRRRTEEKKSHKPMTKTLVEDGRRLTEDDLWFDDVDPDDIEASVGKEAADIVRGRQANQNTVRDVESVIVKQNAFDGLTRAVAMDCEMVGVGVDGEDSILARVSIVNHFGKCIYDKFVQPTEQVTDYRTAVSGVRPEDMQHGEKLQTVQKEVADILKGRVLVGHAIHNDLKVLFLNHPKKKIRDTQKYKPFRKIAKSNRPSLKSLCKEILNIQVQQAEHSSVQDAQATMRLYTMVKKTWEAEIKARRVKDPQGGVSARGAAARRGRRQ